MPDLKMPELNNVLLAGNLTRDPELRTTPSGADVCKMGLAVTRRYKTQDGQRHEETLFINVTAWNKLAKYCGEHLRKGRPVVVEGALKMNEWDDRETGKRRSVIEVHANRLQALSWDSDGGGESSKQPANSAAASEAALFDDDIPF